MVISKLMHSLVMRAVGCVCRDYKSEVYLEVAINFAYKGKKEHHVDFIYTSNY